MSHPGAPRSLHDARRVADDLARRTDVLACEIAIAAGRRIAILQIDDDHCGARDRKLDRLGARRHANGLRGRLC